jgi:hypothetical protein
MVAFVGAGLLTAVAVSGAGATSRPLHRSTRAQMPHRAGSAVTSASDFGDSVAISGTTAVVGAVGAAYIFTEGSGGWPSTPTVTLSDPADSTGDLFGASVAISGSVAVVGASGAGATPGSAYVYVDGTSGWPTTPTATLTDPKQVHSDLFGTSVAVSNGTIVVGAKGVKEGRGAVYIYQQGASGWPSQPTVSLKDPGKAPGDAFGQAVAVSGTTTVVGAYQGKAAGGGSYVYSEHGSHWSSKPSAVLNDPASTAGDEFGEAVDVSGSTVVIAAPDSANGGAVYFYVKGSSRWPTTPMTALSDPLATAADAFGWSVSLSGAVAVVGAPGTASQSGSAYVYDETTSGWPTTPTQTLTDPGGMSLDAFGDAIALSGTTLLIGAPNTDSSGGAAYFYT